MGNMHIWILLATLLFLLEFAYIRLADKLNIIDKPNLRSSHSIPVVRGGGIIFPLAWLIMSAVAGWKYPLFTSGLLLLSSISFWDDMRPLSAGQRFIFHIISCVLLMSELSLWYQMPIWGLPIIFIAIIGVLNAFNFMDGINGMTGFYGLSFIIPLILHMSAKGGMTSIDPLSSPVIMTGISIMVFGFFNFRKKARCFAGDVGSISIGYILVFFLLSLMISQSGNLGIDHTPLYPVFDPTYILMFSVYGVDTVMTILLRIKLRENIFEAHRRHLYQYLANEMKIPHLSVSFIYGLTQLFINLYVLSGSATWWGCLTILASLSVVYVVIKSNVMRRTTHLI
jgi:UDP-N-acetylmuramyl pentapeptide phosphotransferase/UDP-N-acetylglucosamine-1-phosphate transferase